MRVDEFMRELANMPGDAEVVVDDGQFLSSIVRAAPTLYEGSNSPAAEFPMYPYVLIRGEDE